MKNLLILLWIITFFTGCLDIKIKSEIPKKTYYDLDIQPLQTKECKNFTSIGLNGVASVSSLDSINIMHKKSNGQTSIVQNIQWIDNPKEMFKTLLLKHGYDRCLSFENASMQRVRTYLFIDLLFLGFVDNEARVEFAYKISDEKLRVTSMGVIHQEKQGASVESLQEIIQEGMDNLLNILRQSKK